MSKKVVIIGSGLGGLSAAAILAARGYTVTVLEKQAVIGGCLQCFSRNGARFETGMHFVGDVSRDSILDRILRLCGVRDSVRFCPLDNVYNEIWLPGKRVKIAAGRQKFIDTLAHDLRCDSRPVATAFDAVRSCARSTSLYDPDAVMDPEMHLSSIRRVFNELNLPADLQNVMGGDASLYAGDLDKTPFASMAFLKEFYSDGAYRFSGGSDTLARAFQDVITANGGSVVRRAEVERIVCADGVAVAVATSDGNEYPADYVISDIHPSALVSMVNAGTFRPAYVRRMQNLANTVSAFTAYITFRKGSMPYINRNIFGYAVENPWDAMAYKPVDWPRGWLYMHHDMDVADGFARSGQIITYMNYSDVARWADSSLGNRPESYAEFKNLMADRLLQAVEREIPGFGPCIESVCTSSPLTYRDYNGTPGGALYGVAKDLSLGPANRVSHRTRIPNLLLTGQNINSHGMLGVLVGTLVACSEMPDVGDLIRQLYG